MHRIHTGNSNVGAHELMGALGPERSSTHATATMDLRITGPYCCGPLYDWHVRGLSPCEAETSEMMG
jgi:hypothetical protein